MELFKKSENISNDENIHITEYCHLRTVREHMHEFVELAYIASGEGVHTIDDNDYKVEHGDLIFVNYNQTHSFTVTSPMNVINILIDPKFMSKEFVDVDSIITMFRHIMFAEFGIYDLPQTQCVHFRGEELKEIDSLMGLIVREYNQKSIGYKSALHGAIRIIFTKLLRQIETNSYQSENKIKNTMLDILSYIEENCDKKLSLEEVAAQSFYNPVYFGRLLKKHCGKSFSLYIKEKRMSKAASLLKSGKLSVESVMSSAGYNDKKFFYSQFKEIYGVTPGKYRNL